MKNSLLKLFILFLVTSISFFSCKKDDPGPGNLATLTTFQASNITETSVTTGGSISNDGGAPITQRGVCYSMNPNPTIANNSTNDGSGKGSFTSDLFGLTASTTYYMRAYATNSAGTAYGNEVIFSTENSANLATLTTFQVVNIEETSVTTGGNIINDGGSPITQRGVCYSTSNNPTTSNNVTNDGSGIGFFTSNLSGLTASTTYFVRAYATNSAGTAYGSEVSFTTASAGIVTNPGAGVTFNGYTYLSIVLGNGQEWMSENLRTSVYANGDPIPNVINDNLWKGLSTGAWVHQNNNNQYENPYGKLYNWHAVVDPRNVCPTGWHVPSKAEWTLLIDYLGGEDQAGGKMKSTGTQYWASPNTDATNESGFSGLPGGTRSFEGSFYDFGTRGLLWSSTESDAISAWFFFLANNDNNVLPYALQKERGNSVRCVRD